MNFPEQTMAVLAEGLAMARTDGFLIVAAAYNENDSSIQLVNNDGMSRAKMTSILQAMLEVLQDHSTRCTTTEPPNLTIGEA